ncbi:helix-turn-helix transcriptional regulator [Streptomyces sp. WAC 06738]|uniref:helix-turn-helix transcriptional regulator n=1 Tax=Streptomyces sp. WAC 06738 TaxID=2203210 RepID=UPI000F6BC388|nr:helix-turn-helix transcriptional regulator [Streptomyces sp. WAC 06738]AZM47520.1 helix-turn-helix transcriptional regulator [Streptomyces sp. WAC 06738]
MGHTPHPASHLCAAGRTLYAEALQSGRITPETSEAAPCVVESGLFRREGGWLVPAPPAEAMERLFALVAKEIGGYRDLALTLVGSVGRSTPPDAGTAAEPAITVWEGKERIDAELVRALRECTGELLTAQPMGNRAAWVYEAAVQRVLPLAERGVRIRSLYSHTARHTPQALDYLARVQHTGLEVRTLGENIERAIIIDREIAFIPAQEDNVVAIEVRHPGVAWYLAATFDHFWHLATPWGEDVADRVTPEGVTGITSVQLKIARLLVEGHLDEAIARRLGMNVRTCRAHIAKLSTALGSDSRTQLGYLLARSGIVDDD